jgi:chromatin assembly factor 1 subunit B
VKFCPYLFRKDPKSENQVEIIDLPYKMIFAVASIDLVALYSTQSHFPISIIQGIHYAPLTDISW